VKTFTRLFPLCFVAYSAGFLGTQVHAAGPPNERGLPTFEMTLQNPNTLGVGLNEVGVENHPEPPEVELCKSFSRIPEPLANYKVSFRVNVAERTMLPISPPLIIPPKETRTVTVSVLPDSTGLCGHWSTRVRVILKFSDNREIASSLQEITELDVLQQARNTPNDDRLVAFLRDPRVAVRAQGIDYLVRSNMDLTAKEALLRHKLGDSDQTIRDKAVQAAGELKLKSFAPPIEKLLAETPAGDSSYSTTYYLVALARISSPTSTDILVSRLDECRMVPECNALTAAIAESGRRDLFEKLERKVVSFLDSKQNSASTDTIRQSVAVLIRAKYDGSITVLDRILNDPQYDGLGSFIIYALADYISTFDDEHERVLKAEVDTSQFLTSHRSAYLNRLDKCGHDADNALLLLVMTGANQSEIAKLAQKGLACPNLEVEATAAHVAAFFLLKDYVPRIQQIANSWPPGNYPSSYNLICKSLNELDGKGCAAH
jgi:hypothetical protein